jgi:hypothetical protein
VGVSGLQGTDRGIFVHSRKVSKFFITFILCTFPDFAPVSFRRVLRDRRQLETESDLKFCCRRGYFGVLVCCLCSMDEILIRYSLVFDRWMTTPTPPFEPIDGSVAMGCTALGFPPCSETCCTILATRGFPCTVAAVLSVRAGALQGPCGQSGSPHLPDHDGLVYHGSR